MINKDLKTKKSNPTDVTVKDMITPENTHLIVELINKQLIIDKYRQVMQTFRVNWFDVEYANT